MFDTLKLTQLVQICRSRSKNVALVGDHTEHIEFITEYLEREKFEVTVCADTQDIPLFATVVILSSERTDDIYRFMRVSENPEFRVAHINSMVDINDVLDIDHQEADSLPTEVFVFRNGDVIRFAGKGSTVLDDYQKSFFKGEILECFPSLAQHKDKIYVVYAGATYENTLTTLLFDYAVADVRRGFELGFTKIIFYNGDESMQQPSLLSCQRIAEYLADEIPADSLFYFCSGHESQKYYDRVFAQGGWKYRMHMMSALRFEQGIKSNCQIGRMQALKEPYEVKRKDKNYVCFNRVPRWHRVTLLSNLIVNGLVENSFYSFDINDINYPNCEEEVIQKTMLPLQERQHMFPMVLNRSKENDNPVNITPADTPYHKNSYFSVVTETVYYSGKYMHWNDITHAGTTFFSEKIFKPLAYKHPFILVSTPGSLAQLRGFGYKSFAPYIDETYDHIVDDVQRMRAIVHEIQRLCNQTTDDWLEWQRNIAPIVEHNFQWLLAEKDLSVTKHIDKYFI